MPIVTYAELTSEDVKSLSRNKTCFVLCVNPLEEHGPHLPLATDTYESEGSAKRLCNAILQDSPDWTFVFLPSLQMGVGAFPYVGSIYHSPKTVAAVIQEIAFSLAQHGFERLLLSNHHGHPRHLLTLDNVTRAINRTPKMRALDVSGNLVIDLLFGGGLKAFFDQQDLSPDTRKQLKHDLHAGAYETSEMLVLRPELVRDLYRNLETVQIPFQKLTSTTALQAGRGLGYLGAPSLATPELGDAYLEFVVQKVKPQVVAFLNGEQVPGMPRKWRAMFGAGSWIGEIKEKWFRRRDRATGKG